MPALEVEATGDRVKWRQLLLPWGAALLLSALLVAAGRRWPTPLLEQPWALRYPALPVWLALALVLLPPLGIALVLLTGRTPGARPGGCPTPTGENRPTERMETR